MPLWPKFLLTPEHIFQVQTPEMLVEKVRQHMAHGRARHPHLIWPEPWHSLVVPRVYVNCGRWMVSCSCGDAPIVHPAWRLAVCFECGAIYRHLFLPNDAAAIEAALVARPLPVNRNWAFPETLNDLLTENTAHGVAA